MTERVATETVTYGNLDPDDMLPVAPAESTPWMEYGRCANPKPASRWNEADKAFADAFHPEGNTVVQAKLVCSACPVRVKCLDYAIRNDIRTGIWGGSTPNERQALMNGQAVPLYHKCRAGCGRQTTTYAGRLYCSQSCQTNHATAMKGEVA